MIILAAEREGQMHYLKNQLIPSMVFLIARADELLTRRDEAEVKAGRETLLAAARSADQLLETLTALVELEARGRKDQE